MADFTPFLQIVHISDLHISDPKSSQAAAVRAWIRKWRKYLPPAAIRLIEDGVAPNDPLAMDLFVDFVKETASDGPWADCETWLVDTGDLTSLGDQPSLKLGKQFLANLKSVCPKVACIYGNHDAWPGKLSFWTDEEMAAQKTVLSNLKYGIRTPTLALRAPIPNGTGEVQLYCMDSVLHSWRNLRALGEATSAQLTDLETLIDNNQHSGKKDFRLLAIHHPVHYPPPRPYFQMYMLDDGQVAAAIDQPTNTNSVWPWAHVVLSGHTHALFPEYGALPSQPWRCAGLGTNQSQFVVGSLMQLDMYNKRSGRAHQCEVLRLYYSNNKSGTIVVDRLFAARRTSADKGTGEGTYQFVMSGNKLGEEMVFTI